MSERPRHYARPDLAVEGCELLIGGVPVSRLAERVGATPFYAYDRAAMARRVARLRATMPERLRLHYAVKANPMPAVVQHMSALVDGLDVASAGELAIALDAGVAARDVSFAGPGKRETEIRQAIAAGVTLNVESETELDVAARCCEQTGYAARLAVRVNPPFELKSSGMQMGGGPKPFGIDAERVPDTIRAIVARHLEFAGLHVYAGSQSLRADAVIDTQARAVELAIELAERSGQALPALNIGGGLGIPYFPGETPLDVDAVGEALERTLARHAEALDGVELVMELGRYLVGEAGFYVCRIVDRKVSRDQVFLITDGGLHQHLAASGNFGQVIRKNYPLLIGNRMDATRRLRVDVVGPLCTPLDVLGKAVELPDARPGDLVVVLQSGAYGLTASPTAFLGHPAPCEVLV